MVALFIKDQKLWYVYNFLLGIPPEQQFVSEVLTAGKYVLGMEFTKESTGSTTKPTGRRSCCVNEDVVATGPMQTQVATFTLCGDGLCIGRDWATPSAPSTRRRIGSPAGSSTR